MISSGKDSYPSVAIVIVNYNGFEFTSACIDSLLHIDYRNSRIILVDNGSNDSSGEMLAKKYEGRIVPILLAVNGGFTGGYNAGIEYAVNNTSDYVLLLNNDTEVHASFLTNLINASLAEGQALVVPKIVCYFDQSRLDHWVGPDINWWTTRPVGYRCYPKDSQQLNEKQRIGVASGCCLLVPVPVIKEIGRLDEGYFMYYEDADFTLRACRAGYVMIYEPAAVILHKCNKSTSTKQPSFFEYYFVNRNVFYFYNKFCPKPVVKYIVFGKIFVRLFVYYVASLFMRNTRLRLVTFLTVRDIIAGTRGPVPQEFYQRNT
jgi:GT2 family glycosyltransferase